MSLYKMKNIIIALFILFFLLSSISSFVLAHVTKSLNVSQRSTYIIHVLPPQDAASSNPFDLKSWHQSFMPDANSTSATGSQLLYSYSYACSGFAARLTKEELKGIEMKPGFVSAIPDRMYQLLTTHTPDFLGLTIGEGIWNHSNLGKGIIIGILDTGVDPEHLSFHDDGVPAPPSKWKGSCNFGKHLCNNKLIGSKAFVDGHVGGLATDETGHGTNTASIAAGNFVKGANYKGLGRGTAVGVAPLAHLAIYKVCKVISCLLVDILAGMDAALEDGIDVISLSLGGLSSSYITNPTAVGAYHAIEKGIVVTAAAGNDGPNPGSIVNGAPWILTVAASTNDRRFKSTVRLGNGDEFDGETLFQPINFTSEPLPLAFFTNLRYYTNKMVLIEANGDSAFELGGVLRERRSAGMIVFNDQLTGNTIIVSDNVLPNSCVSYDAGMKIKSYINSTENPTASLIFKGTTFGSVAPEITFFSSRGPNIQSPGILKPDVTGPGINILAAGTFPPSKALYVVDKQPFNVESGTSMSTPHLAGVTALVKCVHPDWSPAAIKSAILTTSYDKGSDKMPIKDEQYKEASVFAIGNGHVDPSKAMDPGLVYDIELDDYIGYLCGLNYSDGDMTTIVGKRVNCSNVKVLSEAELNYPTILVSLISSNSSKISRTVTNVGNARSTYKVEMEVPEGISLMVDPEILQFSKVNEKKSFNVTVIKTSKSLKGIWKAQLKWVSNIYIVRSVISEVKLL
ncbi:Peptidase S8 subtilisin-related protein [Dioscorea alata]|uniref:Peptidase S8 subtilisin-related protein n=1 Tax=Dioscorea alata TaxID=55571 RepID=A0ACB7UI68_DIOAL|nr:Peptidase S8 subtilisin-related protein [Dioscorea alata]